MPNSEHIDILLTSADEWNRWRASSKIKPDLSHADLRAENLRGYDLRFANLTAADLWKADLSNADLRGARLDRARLDDCVLTDALLPEPKDLGRLKKGIRDWNSWRSGKQDLNPDLRFLRLRDTSLEGIDLRNADLRGAHLERINLQKANLSSANLEGAKLVSCTFFKTTFNGANLRGLNLSNSSLSGCWFSDARMSETNLERCILARVDFRGADLTRSNLKRAVFEGADLKHANLSSADLSEANLRGARGLTLDDNFIRGARFSLRAKDPWSVLRRNYTGPRLLTFLLLLVIAAAPYTARVMMWSIINRTQGALNTSKTEILADVEASIYRISADIERIQTSFHATNSPEVRAAIAEFRAQLIEHTESVASETVDLLERTEPCLSGDCTAWPLWKVLLRLDESNTDAALTFIILLYYCLRWIVTSRTSLLREDEERSGYSPPAASYTPLFLVHKFVFFLGFIAALVFGLRLHEILSSEILLPSG